MEELGTLYNGGIRNLIKGRNSEPATRAELITLYFTEELEI